MEGTAGEEVKDGHQEGTAGEEVKDSYQQEPLLNYVDKFHTMLVETGQRTNRTLTFLILFTFILIALSTGVIQADQKVTLAGFNFTISSWLIFIGGSWIIGSLIVYYVFLSIHQILLVGLISEIYSSLGLPVDFPNFPSHPLTVPSFLFISAPGGYKAGNIITYISGTLLVILLFFLPIAAEILACIRLISLYGWAWWVLLSSFLVVIMTIGYYFHLLRTTIPIALVLIQKSQEVKPPPTDGKAND